MKNFISVKDVTDLDKLIDKALLAKASGANAVSIGKGKRIGLLFFNPSLRTRLSSQIAASNLGMEAIVFNVDKEGWALEFMDGAVMNGNTVEHIKDAAPVLGSYFDILCIRTFPGLKDREEDDSEMVLNKFIEYSGVPVVSLESSTLHPLQSLADVITIKEFLPESKKPKIVLTWAPHVKALPQCVANSFSEWINAWGNAEFVIARPDGYELNEKYTAGATQTSNQLEALENADFVYVKNWSSYHQYGKILSEDESWMLTEAHLKNAPNAKVMHCLPVRRNIELSDEILDSKRSLVSQQAANRVWAAQAVFSEILNA